jgi:DNA polymerase-4
LDEAYLDVTESQLGIYASQIAKRIQNEVLATTGLSCSAGVGPNKLVAKIASDYRKPAGLTVIPPQDVAAFMQNLPVRKIHGVGPATEKRLEALGIRLCTDLRTATLASLEDAVGSWAKWLKEAAYGLDFRHVESKRKRKSYGRETTFARDIRDLAELESELAQLLEQTIADIRRINLKPRTITLKVRYANFERVTRSCSPGHHLVNRDDMMAILQSLLREKTEAGRRPMRLIGLSLSRFAND